MDTIHSYLMNDFFTIGGGFISQMFSLSVWSSVLLYVNGCASVVLSNDEQFLEWLNIT